MDNIQVSVILGSDSDLDLGKAAINSLKSFDISCELKVISAHRSPDVLVDYLKSSKERGCKAYIAIAGMAAHLAGAVAAHSTSPVLGVPAANSSLNGLDAIVIPGGFSYGDYQLYRCQLVFLLLLLLREKQEQQMLESLQHKCLPVTMIALLKK